ncbi:MAG: hypothetical protein V7K92_24945 [Nostoc sp.]
MLFLYPVNTLAIHQAHFSDAIALQPFGHPTAGVGGAIALVEAA